MICCDVGRFLSPGKHRHLRPTRMLDFDMQVHYGSIAHLRHPPARLIDLEYMDGQEKAARVGPMERLIDWDGGFERAANVADLRRVRRARERSRARQLAV